MEGYIKWFDGLSKVLRIVLSIFGIFCFLYRLFAYIRAEQKESKNLVYLILNIVPLVSIVVFVLDIVAAVKEQPVPLAFGK